jgi:uncharacterized membrane protein
VTIPGGINDSGLIVGYATQNADKRFKVFGFLYDGATFTKLRDSVDTATYAFGINNAGIVVGAAGSLGTTDAFEMRNNRYKMIHFPGQYIYGSAQGINSNGEIVGFDTLDALHHAYIYYQGRVKNIDFPGAVHTAALGVNDSGLVVGWYIVASGCACAFVTKNGKYISFSYPAAQFTAASGINSSGQIVGSYTLDNNSWHGFVTSPITDADFQRPGCCRVAVVETTP